MTHTKSKRWLSLVLALCMLLPALPMQSYAANTVNSATKLNQFIITHRDDGTTVSVTLGTPFILDTPVISDTVFTAGTDIVIDGDGQTLVPSTLLFNLAEGDFTIENVTIDNAANQTLFQCGNGNLTLNNIDIQGNSVSPSGTAVLLGGGNVDVSSLTMTDGNSFMSGGTASTVVTINNSEFVGLYGCAIDAQRSTALIKNSYFHDFKNPGADPVPFEASKLNLTNCYLKNILRGFYSDVSAIQMREELTLLNCTIENCSHSNPNGGYSHGAIGGKPERVNAQLTVDNCYFINNETNKYGGAITLRQFDGTATITYCLFENNTASGADKNADGGAIGVYNNGGIKNFDLTVKGCTFAENNADDDGSAVFAENSIAGTTNSVALLNNTFYNNTSGNYSYDGGGAIQMSGNVDLSAIHNTFYKNTKSYRGAAIGYHATGSVGAGYIYPRLSAYNNLFIDNLGSTGNFQNVYWGASELTESNNVGFDNGTAVGATITAANAFKTDANGNVELANTNETAGCDREKKEIYYIPLIGTDGITDAGVAIAQANNKYNTYPALDYDQAGVARKSPPDAGAVEFLAPIPTFTVTYSDGLSPADTDTVQNMPTSPVTGLLANNSYDIPSGTSNTPTRAGYRFDGWDLSGGGLTGIKQPGEDFIMPAADVTLTAQWTKVYNVIYDNGLPPSNTDTVQNMPASPVGNLAQGDTYTISDTVPTRAGYTFQHWETTAVTGSAETYQPKGAFQMPAADITLTAVWKRNNPGGGGGGGTDPSATAELLKVDAKDPSKLLSGATFELYQKSSSGEDTRKGSYTTNSEGKIRVTNLSAGEYYWLETVAPTGYKLDDTKHTFTLGSSGTKTVTVKNTPNEVPEDLNGDDHFAYIVGYSDQTVRPQNNISRAEVATIFFRLLGDDARSNHLAKTNAFTDVGDTQWFNTAISTMNNISVVKGYPDGGFHPNDTITRAEFAAIAARFDKNTVATTTGFTDVSGHWAQREIAIAAANGWVKGYEDGSFRPDQSITRAEAVTLINRVLQRNPESPSDLLSNMAHWSDNADTTAWYYLAIQEATNSHYYERKANSTEQWTTLRENRDWVAEFES